MRFFSVFTLLLMSFLYADPSFELAEGKGYKLYSDTLDVGTIKQGGSVQFIVMIENKGDDLLEVTQIRSTCPCFKIALLKPEIEVGSKEGVFKLKVLSEGLESVFCKKIYVHTNIPENEISSIYIRGKVE